MWQKLYEEIDADDFEIVAVAMDADVEAARPWVAEAAPTFTTLVDENHTLSELYSMVNVPQAVWIDEAGKIVRPTETGGSLDILREFDFEAGAFKPEAQAQAEQVKTNYLAAVKDWVRKGADSAFVFDDTQARAHVPIMTADESLAHTKFRLGQYLKRAGRADEAEQCFAQARELHPDSWNIFRETTERMETGIAAGEEFWAKVMSLGDKQYYATIDMDGLSK